MKAANFANSKRLQRVAGALSSGQWLTTRTIIELANVCAVNSAVSELRANGIAVECKREGDVWSYRLPCRP